MKFELDKKLGFLCFLITAVLAPVEDFGLARDLDSTLSAQTDGRRMVRNLDAACSAVLRGGKLDFTKFTISRRVCPNQRALNRTTELSLGRCDVKVSVPNSGRFEIGSVYNEKHAVIDMEGHQLASVTFTALEGEAPSVYSARVFPSTALPADRALPPFPPTTQATIVEVTVSAKMALYEEAGSESAAITLQPPCALRWIVGRAYQ